MNLVRAASATVVAALLAGAPAAHAATSATANTPVTATIANSLEGTFPGAYDFGTLSVGNNLSTEQVTTVKSNLAWGMKVSTDALNGRMTQVISGIPNPLVTLSNPLEWSLSSVGGSSQSASWNAFSATPASVVTNQAATGDSGSTVGVKYRQNVSYADQNASYGITVKYTAQQGF